MKKEKIQIEYPLARVSKTSLWPCLATSAGLAEWFADDVSESGKIFTFKWKDHHAQAELVSSLPYNHVRFHWTDDDEQETYFEFHLHKMELSGDLLLEIIDFVEENEKQDAITLWDTQVKTLKRRLGV